MYNSLISDEPVMAQDGLRAVLRMPTFHAPLALILPGSGVYDVNGISGRARISFDLADALESVGIGSLRFAKAVLSSVTFSRYGRIVEEYLHPIHAALHSLANKGRPASPALVIGHSYGGRIAPLVARSFPTVRGVALLNSHTASLKEVLDGQSNSLGETFPGMPNIKKLFLQRYGEALEAESLYDPRPDLEKRKYALFILASSADEQIPSVMNKAWCEMQLGGEDALEFHQHLRHDMTDSRLPTGSQEFTKIAPEVAQSLCRWSITTLGGTQ